MQTLLSIVIANYNYGRFLDEAIESICSQTCQDFEIIIIDGGSTDNSVEVIQRRAKGLQAGELRRADHARGEVAYWISEPDSGQSDAFNKGFAKARGRFLTWLNADDVMLPGTVEKLRIASMRHPAQEWFVGGCFWLDPEMRVINCGRARPFSNIRYREGCVSTWGPSSFFTKRLLDSAGGVDVRFHFTMDTDLWLRFAYKVGARYMPFCNYAWGLRLHPEAKMSGHNFTADGMLDTEHGAAENLHASKHHAQMEQEARWMAEYFSASKPTRVSRILSVSWWRVLCARYDLLRFRGKHYMEYFT